MMRTTVPIPIYTEFPFLAAPGVDRGKGAWRYLRDLVSIQLPTHKLLNRWRSAGLVDTARQRRRDRHQALAGLRPRRSVETQISEMRRWVRTPPRLLWQREGSAIAYWYRVIAAPAAAVLAGSLRGRLGR